MTQITIGWGLIGTGRIAEERVLPGINSFSGNTLVGVVSRDRARAEDFAKRFGAQRAYTSFDELLANPDVTVVAIHTPNAQHAEQAIAAARAGKHVFCDKPMATTVEDARRMIDACEQAGVKLGINFHSRFMPGFADARRIIDSGEIGAVQLVQIEASPGDRGTSRAGTWRTDAGLAGLGTTMSIGVHVFDILRYLLSSEVATVSSFFDTPPGVMETTNFSMLRFADGVLAQVSVHEITPYPHNDFVIYGSKGRIVGRGMTRSRAGGEMHVTSRDGRTRVQAYPAFDAHTACVVDFSKAVLENREPGATGYDGLRSVELTVAMAKSARGGGHVRVGVNDERIETMVKEST